MLPDMIVYGVIAAVVAGSAIGMLVSRNAVYSALFLVLNFASVALIYLLLGAPFIAMTQVTVYAGAIMVLFLFVIMLLGAEHLPDTQKTSNQGVVAFVMAVVFLAELGMVLLRRGGDGLPIADLPAGFGSPTAIGELLFTRYVLPFEVVSIILLIGIIGAIALIQRQKNTRPALFVLEDRAPEEKEA
jgi:NADH-quinone oxidoreductase subunit J